MSWKSIVHSSLGVNHKKQGTVCQDYGNYECFSDVIIGAVADGAGSAKYSDYGAKETVEAAITCLKNWYFKSSKDNNFKLSSEEEVRQLFHHTLNYILQSLSVAAKKNNYYLKDLACTLLLFIAKPNWIAAMQIGDGFIVIQSLDEPYQLLFQPNKGEFINETTFVTSKDAYKKMQVCLRSGLQTFICVSTDGIERLAIRQRDWMPSPAFFDPLKNYLQTSEKIENASQLLQTFLDSERLNQRTDDDKTLLLCLYDETDKPIDSVIRLVSQPIEEDKKLPTSNINTSRLVVFPWLGLIENSLGNLTIGFVGGYFYQFKAFLILILALLVIIVWSFPSKFIQKIVLSSGLILPVVLILKLNDINKIFQYNLFDKIIYKLLVNNKIYTFSNLILFSNSIDVIFPILLSIITAIIAVIIIQKYHYSEIQKYRLLLVIILIATLSFIVGWFLQELLVFFHLL